MESGAEYWSKPMITQKEKYFMCCKALTLLRGSQKPNLRCRREEERREDYWLTSPINLLLCYVACNLCARSSHVMLLIKSHTTVFWRDYRGEDQPEAKNMLFRVYNRNANQIICRKRRREGNDLIRCTTVWWLMARSKKVLTRGEKTKVHCYSYSFQIRTLFCI